MMLVLLMVMRPCRWQWNSIKHTYKRQENIPDCCTIA